MTYFHKVYHIIIVNSLQKYHLYIYLKYSNIFKNVSTISSFSNNFIKKRLECSKEIDGV